MSMSWEGGVSGMGEFSSILLSMKKSILPVSRPIQSRIAVPGSKSMTNRALLLAALAKGESVLTGGLPSDDTLAFLQGLRALGVVVHGELNDERCIVKG